MIVRLAGTLIARQPPFLVVDVGGVGYEVEAPITVFDHLPAVGEPVELLTHLVVREDAHVLYGFARESDRRLFRELLKVSGIGPRLALGILSGVRGEDFAVMVEAGDTDALTRLPGIGKKTAERLILEMRSRIDGLSGGSAGRAAGSADGAGDAAAEARAGLAALGYSTSEALKMVRGVETADRSAEAIIREALKARMAG